MIDELQVLQDLERRLIDGCCPTPRRGLHRWPWAAAGALTAAVAGVAALFVLGSASVAPTAALALNRAAAAVALQPSQAPLRPGEFWYTRTIASSRAPLPIVPRIVTSGQPPLVWFLQRESSETWIGLDGTLRERHVELSIRFASSVGRARWRAARQPLPHIAASDSITAGDGWFPPQGAGGLVDVGDGLFSYRQLMALPTDVLALRARIEAAQAGFQARLDRAFARAKGHGVAGMQYAAGPRVTAMQLQAESDLQAIAMLLASPIPTDVRASLYRVAATLPGVRYAGEARDPLGRSGVAVAIGHGPQETRMIFDPDTGALLADVFGDYLTSTIVAQGVVGSIDALPHAVAPVPGPRGLEPQVLAVHPRVGGRRTAFTLEVLNHGTRGRRAPAPAFDAMLFGPSGPRCQSSVSSSPFVTLARHAVTAARGGVSSTYRLSPRASGASAWCPGRYQLVAVGSGDSNSQSQSAIYFEVR